MGNNSTSIEGRTEYLQMIQGTIDRMSTSSAIFKGFTAAVLAGVSALSFSETSTIALIMPFIPILCFTFLDIYYLQLERRFRYLYQQVRLGSHDVDFDLDPPKASEILRRDNKSNVRLRSCCHSTSILLFYLPMLIISIIIVILKIGGHLG